MSNPKVPEPAAAPHATSPADLSRRDFLRASAALAGATLLASCRSGDDDPMAPIVGGAEGFLANINRFVVVMFENRSFDNLLGYLYSDPKFATPANWPSGWTVPPGVPQLANAPAQTFNGLWQFPGTAPVTASACVGTAGCNTLTASYQPVVAFPHNYPVCPGGPAPAPPPFEWNFPNPNAEEGFAATREQLGKEVTLPGSATKGFDLTGFLQGYTKSTAAPAPIMGSYTPDQLPVLSGLARSFAVFDNWHCAVPSETYCNRAFFHASTSWGFVENGSSKDDAPPADKWTKWQSPPGFVSRNSIFDLLEQSAVPWGVYFGVPGKPAADETQVAQVFSQVGLTGLVHYEVGKNYGPPAYQATQPGVAAKQRFWPLENFFADVGNGKLPAYTFIEPVYGAFPGNPVLPGGHDFHPNEDVRQGEEVLRQIYEAIRKTGGTANDYTKDTMLLVVFDEHGGTYDHVSPPTGVPAPGTVNPAPEFGFDFTTLGLRVPAIAISSYTLANTVVNQPLHHAAVINTLLQKFVYKGASQPYLTLRDKGLNGGDLHGAYNGVRAAPWPPFTTPVDAPAVPAVACKT